MSPKEPTKQPRRKRPPFAPERSEVPPNAVFSVEVTNPDQCTGLVPGCDITLDVRDDSVRALDGTKPLGLLEARGVEWVHRNGYSACVFLGHEGKPGKRLRVKITGR